MIVKYFVLSIVKFAWFFSKFISVIIIYKKLKILIKNKREYL